MRKVLIVIRREYLSRVRTRAFILGTLLTPLLMLALVLIPGFLASRGAGDRSITVLDQSGDPALFELIRRSEPRAEQSGLDLRGARDRMAQFALERVAVPPDANIDDLRQEYNERVLADSNAAYVVLRPGVLEGEAPEYYARNVSDMSIGPLRNLLNKAITERRLELAGYDVDRLAAHMKPVTLSTRRVGADGDSEEGGASTFILAFVMLIFIYMTILMYGLSVMRGVIEEKQSRIVEVMVSSLRPTQMMLGKLVGIGLVGLTQYVIWVASAAILSIAGASLLVGTGVTLPRISMLLLVYFVIYFILGYFLFATLYAMVGATVSNEEEAQQAQAPVTILIVVPMILFTMVLNNPGGTSSVVLSMVPFFAPTLMILRIALIEPPFWQILLSMLIMVATTLGIVWLAARIYRVGILMYGKRPSITELGRWLTYT